MAVELNRQNCRVCAHSLSSRTLIGLYLAYSVYYTERQTKKMESKDEVCPTTIDPDRQEVSELESRLTDRANEILEYCGLQGKPLDAKLD